MSDPAPRLQSLDVIRGLAILLICLVNVAEGMGSTLLTHVGNVRLSGWAPADATSWWLLHTFVEGTQRGLLQLLLGGSIILLTRNARARGVSEAATLVSRYASLALFGLCDIMLIGWYGDILLEYSIAALIAAPFRRFAAWVLMLLGAGYLVWTVASGLLPDRPAPPHVAAVHHVATQPRAASDHGAIVIPPVTPTSVRSDPAIADFIATERAAHLGGPAAYVGWAVRFWRTLVLPHFFIPSVIASVFFMLLGMGLFKLGFMQGALPGRVYVVTLVVGLAIGLTIRIPGSQAVLLHNTLPHSATVMAEVSRLALSLAYAAGLILLLRGPARAALGLLAAPGRVAFSLYLLQNFGFIFLIFNGGGLALFGRFSWFGLTAMALASIPLQILLATLWLARFEQGPLEWLWRSLAQRRILPFRRRVTA